MLQFYLSSIKIRLEIWGSLFEQQLVDYDKASYWCNWIYLAGDGNEPGQNRIFNIEKQAQQ